MTETPDATSSSDTLLDHGYFRPRVGMRKNKKALLPQKGLLLVSFLCVAGAAVYYFWSEHSEVAREVHTAEQTSTKPLAVSTVLLNNNATLRFRDNLLPFHKYITAFSSSGFTNQVMATVNLIYLATLTGRTPIVPPFLPEHFGSLDTVAPIGFGDVFDIPRLANELGIPIVEWHEVKEPMSSETESIGCWSTRAGLKVAGNRPAPTSHPDVLKLGKHHCAALAHVSYTPMPSTFTLSRGAIESDYVMSTWAVASLAYPESRQRQLDWQRPHILQDGSGRKTEPDDQLLCFDLLYYLGLMDPNPSADFFADYSPFWNLIGTRLHWKQSVTELASQYLRRHFGVMDGGPIPPFISVHVRRTDFETGCYGEKDPEKCFASVKIYERRVKEIKQSLLNRPNGVEVAKVMVTSDEHDPKWWERVAALGPEWGWIDHAAEKTSEKHGQWFPMILDAVVQSMGTGFVGTDHSTMSHIAWKRVQDWQGGLGVEVRWGNPSADDH